VIKEIIREFGGEPDEDNDEDNESKMTELFA